MSGVKTCDCRNTIDGSIHLYSGMTLRRSVGDIEPGLRCELIFGFHVKKVLCLHRKMIKDIG